ncbi:MAG TPA: hypothetical protein VN664_12270 [Burkholderiales bacterium]|nr:hypothetical protein [Burkholderiales bacterium]
MSDVRLQRATGTRRIVFRIVVAMIAAIWILPAFAARTFPEKAVRGEMKAHNYPYMKIGGKTLRLPPGGKIFNEQNLIIMPASLPSQTAQIMYTTDMNGDLSRVWLLTAEEAARYPIKK